MESNGSSDDEDDSKKRRADGDNSKKRGIEIREEKIKKYGPMGDSFLSTEDWSTSTIFSTSVENEEAQNKIKQQSLCTEELMIDEHQTEITEHHEIAATEPSFSKEPERISVHSQSTPQNSSFIAQNPLVTDLQAVENEVLLNTIGQRLTVTEESLGPPPPDHLWDIDYGMEETTVKAFISHDLAERQSQDQQCLNTSIYNQDIALSSISDFLENDEFEEHPKDKVLLWVSEVVDVAGLVQSLTHIEEPPQSQLFQPAEPAFSSISDFLETDEFEEHPKNKVLSWVSELVDVAGLVQSPTQIEEPPQFQLFQPAEPLTGNVLRETGVNENASSFFEYPSSVDELPRRLSGQMTLESIEEEAIMTILRKATDTSNFTIIVSNLSRDCQAILKSFLKVKTFNPFDKTGFYSSVGKVYPVQADEFRDYKGHLEVVLGEMLRNIMANNKLEEIVGCLPRSILKWIWNAKFAHSDALRRWMSNNFSEQQLSDFHT